VSVSPIAAGLTFVAIAVMFACGWSWLAAICKAAITWRWLPEPLAADLQRALAAAGLSPRLPLVAWSPRRAVPWAFFDLVALFGISVLVSEVLRRTGIAAAAKIDSPTLAEQRQNVFANGALSLAILVIGAAMIAIRTRATLCDFGWSRSKLRTDLRLGLIGFVMIAPPVYALQGALVFFWQESKHPLMEMFKASPDLGLFLLLLVTAAVVAPLFEELIFRVVLQGFLEKAIRFRGPMHELFFGEAQSLPAAPLESAADNGLNCGPATQLQPELRGLSAWLPIAISSAIFALLHYSHGPDWIPLFFLALGMGYLYQRTHRLLPSLIVHGLLNSFSMSMLWVQVRE
jgi:membrane protease YdiL (CAAX protease family)